MNDSTPDRPVDSSAKAEAPKAPAKSARAGLAGLVVLVLVVTGVFFDPTGVIRGGLTGEPFFRSRPASYWQEQLLGGPGERTAARAAFEQGAQQGVPVLMQILQTSNDSEARWKAASLLGKLGPDAQASAPTLLNALDDPDPFVQSVAAEVLPLVGTPAQDAVPALARLLETEHAAVAARAISEYRAQAEPALPQLIALLQDTSRPAEARWNAARTIGKTGPGAIDALPVLIEMTRDEESTVRGNSAEAIGDIGPSAVEGVPALVAVLKDSDHRVRKLAVRALNYIGPAAADAVPAIRELLNDPDAAVQAEARNALQAIAPEAVTESEQPEAARTDDQAPVRLGTPE